MAGLLTLVPTPIAENLPLEPVALALLQKACASDEKIIIAVEDLKPARQRWSAWGLPREWFERFVPYNEHTREETRPELLRELKTGAQVFLLSDAGLPAFCDPGRELVNACHENKIKVTSTPFPNSIALALALSGYAHERFYFAGFPPAKGEERSKALKEALSYSMTTVLMDTPYRLSRLLSELKELGAGQRQAFVGMGLNSQEELLLRGKIVDLLPKTEGVKSPFILVLPS
jgi:16S rRNA (cytidine1402-2'-O)-methyltransferase